MNLFHRTNWKFFAIVVVFAVLVGGGALWYVRLFNQQIRQLETSNVTLQIPKDKKSEIDTSGWQTYRNSEFGFEVKYPEDWKAQQTSPRKIFITDGGVGNFERLIIEKFDDNNLNLSLDDWMASFAVGRNVRGIPQKVLLNGMEAYRIDGEFFRDLYLMSRDGSIFVAYLQNDKSGDLTTLNQILSTFRFVE